jgi:non-heme chloroperoxidase
MGTTTGTLRQGPTTVRAVRGGGGLRLHVREWGRPDGRPVLFLHGWSQSHLCWAKQYHSALAQEFRLVASDLRGHGMLEAPPEPGALHQRPAVGRRPGGDHRPARPGPAGAGRLVLRRLHHLRLPARPRYGPARPAGRRRRGHDAGRGGVGTLIGPDFLDNVPDATANNPPTNIRGMRALVQAFPAKPLPPEEVESLLGSSMTVPAPIRASLQAREINGDDVLRTLRMAVLVSHGRADTVILPAMAEHILATSPVAEPSWYDGVGHTTFLEDPDRFNHELAALTRRVTSPSPA